MRSHVRGSCKFRNPFNMGANIVFVFSWFLFITMITPIIKMIRGRRDFYIEQGFAMGVSCVEGQCHSKFLSDPIGRMFELYSIDQ
jgi:hypothetical protein